MSLRFPTTWQPLKVFWDNGTTSPWEEFATHTCLLVTSGIQVSSSQLVCILCVDWTHLNETQARTCTEEKESFLQEEMATHCSILVWKIPWTEEPGELQSRGLQRVRHDLVTSLSLLYLHTYIHIPLVQFWIEKVKAESLLSSRGKYSIFCQE